MLRPERAGSQYIRAEEMSSLLGRNWNAIMPHGYWRPPPRNARREKTLPGRHRKTYRLASLLHLTRRKWPHCPRHRDAGEIGARARMSTLSTLLRRRRAASVAEPLEAEVIRRHRLGQQR